MTYFEGRETIEDFTWSPQQTLESPVLFYVHPKEFVRVTIDDEGLSTSAYIEFDIDDDEEGFPIVLREVIPPSHPDGDFTVVDTTLIKCQGYGRYGLELQPEFVRGGVLGGADVVTLAAPHTPRYWTSALTFSIGRIGGKANNFSIYLIAGGGAKPKPFWTDGQGCNYVIQAGVNR